jgi:hypothetical protein
VGWLAAPALAGMVLLSGLIALAPLNGANAPPGGPGRGTANGPTPAAIPEIDPINASLSVGGVTGYLSPDFWGTTVSNEVWPLRDEADVLNATPAHVIVWPGAMGGEDYDPLTNTHYNTYNGTATPAPTTEAQFVAMCKAIHCTAILQVPAEIDNPSFAEEIVNYTEVNLSFRPAYWMLGNEPELWQHWKVPWSQWPTKYTTGPNPTQFGDEALAYVAKIRNVDTVTPILGLPASGCTCGYYTFSQWINGVLAVTGSKIQAVAFHEYPAGWLGNGDGSLLDFYLTLQSSVNIPTRMVSARAAVQNACSGCNVSVFISELGSALSWSSYGQYAAGFSGALSIAAQITQAMDSNVSNLDLFAAQLPTTNSWFNQTGYARPDYALYTQIFDHLGSTVFPVNVTGLGGSLYGIATQAPDQSGREDLLVVNTNITHSTSFQPAFPDGTGAAPVEAWYWNGSIHPTSKNHTTWVEPYTPDPQPQLDPDGLPATYVLPPQSLVLFEAYPSGASFVRLGAAGLPPNTSWYASVGSQFYTTDAPNLSLLLAPGAYPVVGVPVPLPIGGTERVPSERLAPFTASPAVVDGPYTNLTLTFVPQWRVEVGSAPAGDGTVWPDVGWWNASQPLTLHVTPADGDTFTWWSGWGAGSYNGSWPTITIVPTGRINETAHLEPGVAATFWAVNLPTGVPWSVTVRNVTTSTNGTSTVVYAPPGRWGFHVSAPTGYRVVPQNGSFAAPGVGTLLQFFPLRPPQPTYPVRFQTTGLPDATSVDITVRSNTQTAAAPGAQFQLSNGTYAYQVGYVPGYHAVAPLKLFNVTGGPLTVVVPFVPTYYVVSWQAQGVWAGLNWSVVVDGLPVVATSAWATVPLLNGSHAYTVRVPDNFTTTPRTGWLTVNGGRAFVPLVFRPMMFPTPFEATGPGALDAWSIRLGNLTQPASANRSEFTMPNGTYTFDVHPPAGYYAVPSHGTLTVAGPLPATQIRFYPVSQKPSAALVAALTLGALEVSGWIAVAAVAGFGISRAIRRRGA